MDLKLDKYIVKPEFAFYINWLDFKYAFMDVEYIPPNKGWTEGTHINNIFKKHQKQYNKHNIYLITIHNGWLKNHGINKNATYPDNSLFEKLDKMINGQ